MMAIETYNFQLNCEIIFSYQHRNFNWTSICWRERETPTKTFHSFTVCGAGERNKHMLNSHDTKLTLWLAITFLQQRRKNEVK